MTDKDIIAEAKRLATADRFNGHTWNDAFHAHLIRLAREGLPVPVPVPVKDDAADLHNALGHCVGQHERIRAIRAFLANRDAERDAEVAELVSAINDVIDYIPASLVNMRISPALAKLEPKP
jgi:hypothetical protein